MPAPSRSKSKPRKRTRAGGPAERAVEACARAVEAFRRGEIVRIEEGRGRRHIALAVETATGDALARFVRASAEPPSLVLTHARARTLKIRIYTPDVVAVRTETPLTARALRALGDPTADLDAPLKGPFESLREKLGPAHVAAIRLAKLAGLLPAAVLARPRATDRSMFSIPARAIVDYDNIAVGSLSIVTRAHVPLDGAEKTELVAFRSDDGGPEHYAIVINAPSTGRPVLARLHSECFTGDLLGSLKCDCGSQLRGAIAAIEKAGGGILLYLAQEGRGIGLVNKLRAYRLQDQGFDTLEANERLGFEPDERLYAVAARMLKQLGFRAVRLMTNNPEKVKALEAEGIEVTARVPHAFAANIHNRRYLETKAQKAGHLF